MLELIAVLLVIYIVIEFLFPPLGTALLVCLGLALGTVGIALAIAFCAAALTGSFLSVKNWLHSIRSNIRLRHWDWKQDSEPARRSYFFGPGFRQLRSAVTDTFLLLHSSAEDMNHNAEAMANRFRGNLRILSLAMSFLYRFAGYACIYLVGSILCALLVLVHGSVTTVFMLIIYPLFAPVWLADRLYLLSRRIRSVCPVCKRQFLIPVFECPVCGARHLSLVPGPYGIWTHRCQCGRTLPATFLNGRSRLRASCPECRSGIVASDARPLVFQLVGGTRSGKTVFLSAFFHQFFRRIDRANGLVRTITGEYQSFFDDLESWYHGSPCPATSQFNAQMYPVLISGLGIKRQFSVFDIAGEMFDGVSADSELAQHQFTYCDGLLFMIDPFSSGTLRENRERQHGDVSSFSEMPPEDVAANFINYLIRVGRTRADARCAIPLAVLITKADLKEVNRAIGPAQLDSILRSDPGLYGSYEACRDAECRKFLCSIGMASTVNDLEAQFSSIHYYPVSAQGHGDDGTPFEPWGIMDAFDWMLPLADAEMAAALNGESAAIH